MKVVESQQTRIKKLLHRINQLQEENNKVAHTVRRYQYLQGEIDEHSD